MPTTRTKPAKPRKDFPLFPHSNGQWAKKIRGKLYYFGPWANSDASEAKYLQDREYLQAGVKPPQVSDGCRVRYLLNCFLTAKETLRDSGELAPRSFQDYLKSCERIADHFGRERLVDDLTVDDFAQYRNLISRGRGLHAIGTQVTICRMVFSFAYDNELIEKPVRFGQNFKRPTKKSMRLERASTQAANGLKMFEAADCQRLIHNANSQLKAMILLALNGGLGASDLAQVPRTAIRRGYLTYARVKTGVHRRIPLWEETLNAIEDFRRPRAKSESDSNLVFLTKYGQRWVRIGPSGTSNIDKVCDEFNKLLRALKLKRPGVSFYALRHTFETIAGGSADQVAVDSIMGHVSDDMASRYRERIDDQRLIHVAEHVRQWLWMRKCDTCGETRFSVDEDWKCESCGQPNPVLA